MLKLRHMLLAGCALLALTPVIAGGPAFAGDQTSLWDKVGPWNIMIDHTVNDGCFAVTGYPGGAMLRLGIDKREGSVYLLYGNRNWVDLEVGKLIPLRITFDNGVYFDGEYRVTAVGPYKMLAIDVNERFVTNFAERMGMDITTRSGKSLDRLRLNGTMAAIPEIVQCQKAQDRNGRPAPQQQRRNTDPSV